MLSRAILGTIVLLVMSGIASGADNHAADSYDELVQLFKEYGLSDFFAEFNEAGSIPVSLIQWQLTGDDSEIVEMLGDD